MNTEKHNVNLALKVFSRFVAEALRSRADELNLAYMAGI